MNEHRIQAFSLRIFIPNGRSQVYVTDKNRAEGWSKGEACRELGQLRRPGHGREALRPRPGCSDLSDGSGGGCRNRLGRRA